MHACMDAVNGSALYSVARSTHSERNYMLPQLALTLLSLFTTATAATKTGCSTSREAACLRTGCSTVECCCHNVCTSAVSCAQQSGASRSSTTAQGSSSITGSSSAAALCTGVASQTCCGAAEGATSCTVQSFQRAHCKVRCAELQRL
jgi:hypothetical protein